jgi:hypothetical protein
MPRTPRPVAPSVRKIPVTRDFMIDFNVVNHFYDWEEEDVALEKVRIRINQAAQDDIPRLARVIRALEVVARHYGWTREDMAQWRAPLRHPGPDRDFILNLALAVQHGYRPGPDNNHVRLAVWLAQNGFTPLDSEGDA